MTDRKTTATDVANVTTNSAFAGWAGNISTVPSETGNVTFNTGFAAWAINTSTVPSETGNVTFNTGYSSRIIDLAEDLNLIGTIGVPDISEPVYRGLLGSIYVFSVGTPPVGATDIVIIGYT